MFQKGIEYFKIFLLRTSPKTGSPAQHRMCIATSIVDFSLNTLEIATIKAKAKTNI